MRTSALTGPAGLAAAGLTALICLTACGATGTVGSSGTTSAAPSSGPAAQALSAAYKGVVGTPPTEPVPVRKGVKAWVMSCGQELPTCSTSSDAVKEAATAIGWSTSICDGKLNPQGWAACIREGTAQHADVIFVIGQDCSSFEGPLREARAAHVTTIGVGSNDCDAQGGERLFGATTQRFEGMTNQQWWNKLGALQADYLIGRTGGSAKVLEVTFADSLWGRWIKEGLTDRLATCTGCSIVGELQLTNADVASNTIGQKFSSALLKATGANAVAVPLDPWFLAGISQGIRSSGRSDRLTVVGGFGQQANLDLIRGGQGEDATIAFDQIWDGWGAVDTALRVLAGQKALPAGIGLQAVDTGHNLPAAGRPFGYMPTVDFRALYQKTWTRT
ncbi:sugar ABC transporter substrate-binding protein [Actinomadura fibrosa]|uniref:Sugar ABC transporter substrate-binding protein n=1 Tax=Actinomadura fibrosa TaxID=111802 RepID=A0ABW2Y402_9ACTN|nr:substrate-binding domain-containing protein [Actinomadura fibrosa]